MIRELMVQVNPNQTGQVYGHHLTLFDFVIKQLKALHII
jgi:hypothetical protein